MESYDENSCIQFQLTDECDNVHDIRPGGSDGSAGDGIYSGKTTLDVIEYIRQLFCDKPLDLKAFRTLFHFIFKTLDDHCAKIKNIACQFVLTTLASGEEVEGYLAKIKTADGGCRTGIIKPEIPAPFSFIPLTTVFSDSAEDLVEGNLPFTTNVNVPASVPAGYNGLILRVYFELDNRNNDISTIQLRLTINDQVMGTVEHGGVNVTDDSFWNGDFFLPPNPSDPTKIKINPTIDFNSAGDPDGDVYAVVVKVVGYF